MTPDEIAEMRVELDDLRAFKRVVMANFQLISSQAQWFVSGKVVATDLGPPGTTITYESHGDNASGECSAQTNTSPP